MTQQQYLLNFTSHCTKELKLFEINETTLLIIILGLNHDKNVHKALHSIQTV